MPRDPRNEDHKIKIHPTGGFCFVPGLMGDTTHCETMSGSTSSRFDQHRAVKSSRLPRRHFMPRDPRNEDHKIKTTQRVVFVLLRGYVNKKIKHHTEFPSVGGVPRSGGVVRGFKKVLPPLCCPKKNTHSLVIASETKQSSQLCTHANACDFIMTGSPRSRVPPHDDKKESPRITQNIHI